MPNKQFLEQYPLYRKFPIDLPYFAHQLEEPSVHLWCEHCKSEQTFVLTNKYGFQKTPGADIRGAILDADFLCAGCGNFNRHFYIKLDGYAKSLTKVGQYPAWEIEMDKNLATLLGAYSDFYKKGLICESQGYGIGAFAYYRRIVETIIDELLESVTDLVSEIDRPKYLEALKKTKQTIVAKEKIELVKDLLPEILRPNNQNPLGLLHDFLSVGLHAGSEEQCLENAQHIREILVFLVNQIIRSKSSSKQFTDSMKKLLEKKSSAAIKK